MFHIGERVWRDPELKSKNFAKVALPELVPVLLTLMTRQEEDADEDEWNISMSVSYCLGALAQPSKIQSSQL